MAPGGVLVALGDLGVRLLTGDGRERARWDVPADQVVMADHGGCALLLVHGEGLVDIHRLDLATRRVRHWATMRLGPVLPTDRGVARGPAVAEASNLVVDVPGTGGTRAWRTSGKVV
ncbi:MAG: hypothetical protein GXX79_07105 [Actinomycetales bacterium]|nr:hypothetical protein [Actinomycetales bacterium]